jgi:hypothetical protein
VYRDYFTRTYEGCEENEILRNVLLKVEGGIERSFQKLVESLCECSVTNAKCGRSVSWAHEIKWQMLSRQICTVGTHDGVNVDREEMRCECELGPDCL